MSVLEAIDVMRMQTVETQKVASHAPVVLDTEEMDLHAEVGH